MSHLASYKAAVRWIAENDDTDWLDDNVGGMSVTACMVSDLFDRNEETVTKDIRLMVAAVRVELKMKESL